MSGHEDLTSATGATLGVYLRLEEAIDGALQGVIVDTDSSAQSIIKHVRRLHESARTLASYLNGTSLQTGDLGKEMLESVAFLRDIFTVIERLPGKKLADVSMAAAAISKLQEGFENMSEYYETRLSVVINHNDDLVRDIGEALGQVQYQDVVRQSIERVRMTVERRNDALRRLLLSTASDSAEELPVQLEAILEDYLAEEGKHRHSVRQMQGMDAPLKLELF